MVITRAIWSPISREYGGSRCYLCFFSFTPFFFKTYNNNIYILVNFFCPCQNTLLQLLWVYFGVGKRLLSHDCGLRTSKENSTVIGLSTAFFLINFFSMDWRKFSFTLFVFFSIAKDSHFYWSPYSTMWREYVVFVINSS